jgi:subtilisin family serine protease
VVAGAGNVDGTGPVVAGLATLPGVLTVAGTDRRGAAWSGSASGPEVGIAAPAVRIVGAVPTAVDSSGHVLGTGTSHATAIVSGTAALVRSRFPNMDAANVVNRLIRTARDLGPAGRDPQFGFGLVQPYRAVTADVGTVTANPLGQLPAGPSQGDGVAGTVPQYRGFRWDRVALVGGVALVVLTGLVVLLVWSVRRRRRPSGSVTARNPVSARNP